MQNLNLISGCFSNLNHSVKVHFAARLNLVHFNVWFQMTSHEMESHWLRSTGLRSQYVFWQFFRRRTPAVTSLTGGVAVRGRIHSNAAAVFSTLWVSNEIKLFVYMLKERLLWSCITVTHCLRSYCHNRRITDVIAEDFNVLSLLL